MVIKQYGFKSELHALAEQIPLISQNTSFAINSTEPAKLAALTPLLGSNLSPIK